MATRKPAKVHKDDCPCCLAAKEIRERIRADLDQWEAGKWAEQVNYGPTCSCNLAGNKVGCYKHKFGPTDEPFSMRT